MKINREDVVQAALTVERWCKEHRKDGYCDCPFFEETCKVNYPYNYWGLEEFLRTRGLRNGEV